MTSGGIFTLIANDGKADNLIYATKLLNTRIAQIKQTNSQAGQDDPSPTLSEIERTHMLFVNAHFKPFVMIGFEYMKSRPTTAGMKLNVDSTSLLKYNIPQFGDFFSDMALNARIKNISDSGVYQYKRPIDNGYIPIWKLMTKLKNGDEKVNFAISDSGTATGTVVTDTTTSGQVYSYKVYNKPEPTMKFVVLNNAGSSAITSGYIANPPSLSELAALALTCFVSNPNDLGVDVDMGQMGFGGNTNNNSSFDPQGNVPTQRQYPWAMQSPPWTSMGINTPITTNANFVSEALNPNNLPITGATGTSITAGISGWYTIENIWVARGWIIAGGGTGGSNVPGIGPTGGNININPFNSNEPFGSLSPAASANIRQATGYLYYYGDGTSTSSNATTLYGYTYSPNDFLVHNAATQSGALNIISSSGYNSFSSGMWVQIEWVQGYIDSDGITVPSGIPFNAGHKWAKQLRFCDFPGHKLIKNIQFTVNNNILDQYDTEVYTMYEKFLIKPEKKVGYYKLIGQQQPIDGYCEENSCGAKQLTKIINGNQVAKTDLSGNTWLWIPLLFWFSKDFRLSIPSVSIPFGQRNIDVTLAALTDLVYAVPGKVFRVLKTKKLRSRLLEQNSEVLFFGGDMFDNNAYNIKGSVGNRNPIKTDIIKVQVTNNDYDTSVGGTKLTNDEIDIDLYINNLFVTPEIHDIFIKRVGFNLIRVYVQQQISLTSAQNELLLSNLKWPIEYLFIGARPTVNKDDPDNWHRFANVYSNTLSQRYLTEHGDTTTNIQYYTYDSVLKHFGIKAHGVSLFDDSFKADFYNAYLPWRYGTDLITPKDDTIFMINFCLYPGDYQPSGHINVSRAREFYFKYGAGQAFDPIAKPTTLYIIASAINFLLISDGSAVLRYTT